LPPWCGIQSAALEVNGGGELRLTANNTYSGQTMIHQALSRGAPGALGGAPPSPSRRAAALVNVPIDGKTLSAFWPGVMVAQGPNCAWNGNVVLNNEPVVLTEANSILNWSGNISGSGGFRKSGPGVFRLSGPEANTFTGAVYVNGGVMELQKSSNGEPVVAISGGSLIVGDTFGGPGADVVRYGVSGQIADTTIVGVSSSGKIELVGWTDLIGALTGSSPTSEVDLGPSSGKLIVGGYPASTTFAGTFSGSGSLVKTDSDTLTLTGASDHTGGTVIEQGALVVNGG
jgi:autotransporter-associated beta strand protein